MRTLHKGFSLVELMIAVVLGLILMTGVIQMFVSTKMAFSSQQALSRVQETGRLAVEFMSRDVRMAGYLGCSTLDSAAVNVLKSSTDFNNNWLAFIKGYHIDNVGSGASEVTGLTHAPLNNTDLFVVRGGAVSGTIVTADNSDTTLFSALKTTLANGCSDGSSKLNDLCSGDIVVEADCAGAVVFQITQAQNISGIVNISHTSATASPGNLTAKWGAAPTDPLHTFGAGSEVIKMNRVVYFVATGASGRPSLFQNTSKADGTPNQDTELLEGVENIHVTYGVDSNGDGAPDGYFSADTSASNPIASGDWPKVLSARIEILVQSAEDNVSPEKQKYTFAGVTKTASDKRLRQVFTSTIGIRSRLP